MFQYNRPLLFACGRCQNIFIPFVKSRFSHILAELVRAIDVSNRSLLAARNLFENRQSKIFIIHSSDSRKYFTVIICESLHTDFDVLGLEACDGIFVLRMC